MTSYHTIIIIGAMITEKGSSADNKVCIGKFAWIHSSKLSFEVINSNALRIKLSMNEPDGSVIVGPSNADDGPSVIGEFGVGDVGNVVVGRGKCTVSNY